MTVSFSLSTILLAPVLITLAGILKPVVIAMATRVGIISATGVVAVIGILWSATLLTTLARVVDPILITVTTGVRIISAAGVVVVIVLPFAFRFRFGLRFGFGFATF